MVIIANIVFGALNGAGIAAWGYIKGETVEKFSARKFLQTLLVGLVVGGIMARYNLDYVQAQSVFAGTGLIVFIDYGLKIFFRRVVPYLRKKLKA